MLSEIVDRLTSMEIKLKDGSFYEVKESDLIAWSRTYKDCNVFYEVKAAAEWCEANPSRRKTLRGVKRFLNAWLSKAHKLKGSPLSYNQKEGHSNIEESLMTFLGFQNMKEKQRLNGIYHLKVFII